MKSTKIMITVLGCFLVTWLSLGSINYLLTNVSTFRDAVTDNGVILFLLVFGWIPSVVVGADLDKLLKN